MAKRRNVSGRVLRNAVPQPRDVAEFVAPRTVNEGLSIKNVFGDVGDMIDPFITAAIEKQEGLRDVSDDELKMLAALGSIPVAGAVASKVTKKLNKLVPNPKGGFVQAVFLPKQGNKAVLVKPRTQEELRQFNKAIDLAAEKGQIPKNDAIKMKINAASDLKEQQYIQRGLNMGVINADVAPQNLNKIKMEDIDPRYLADYKTAEAIGNKYKVKEYPVATTKAGNTYYTTGEGGNQLLYSENTNDATNARHRLTDYDMKYKDAVEDLKRALPDPKNPNRYKLIYDKEGRLVNPYKLIVEPTMLEKRLPFRTQEASSKSLNQGKRELEQNPRYMSPDDFLKYMLGLEP